MLQKKICNKGATNVLERGGGQWSVVKYHIFTFFVYLPLPTLSDLWIETIDKNGQFTTHVNLSEFDKILTFWLIFTFVVSFYYFFIIVKNNIITSNLFMLNIVICWYKLIFGLYYIFITDLIRMKKLSKKLIKWSQSLLSCFIGQSWTWNL